LEKLREQLDELIERLENEDDFRVELESLKSIYPFNEFEYIISNLLGKNKLTLEDYKRIRENYIEGGNKYQHLYDLSSKKFGSVWAETHVKTVVPNLLISTSSDFDFLLPPENIRIEVKASRATDSKSNKSFTEKSILFRSDKKYDMNFQQIKPRLCDVFIWIGIWRDLIQYWVLSSFEVEHNSSYADKQHKGNVGEGQLHIKQQNIKEFQKFIVEPENIEEAIRQAFIRERKLRKL
jgi:hypothetical protein